MKTGLRIPLLVIAAIFFLAGPVSAAPQKGGGWRGGWLPEGAKHADEYAAFRGSFTLGHAAKVRIEIIGAHWFGSWLDGEFLTEGPNRFPRGHAEYEVILRQMEPGEHVLSALVHNQGVSTRLLRADSIPPFLLCRLFADGREIVSSWKVERFSGYKASGVRISPQFAWIEWADMREVPDGWQAVRFDDSGWKSPSRSEAASWKMRPLRIGPVRHFTRECKLIGRGSLSGPFEAADTPSWPKEGDVSWYKRNLHPAENSTGVWRRYDLGRVRLGTVRFTLDLPPGAVIEFAYSEALAKRNIVDGYSHDTVVVFTETAGEGRVVPYIPLSAPYSRNMDHYVARGGVETFSPLTPKGGRYIEVHIEADTAKVKFLNEEFIERSYYGEPAGAFDCGDDLLDQVWMLGVNTLQACAEDAVIDNPTRERGQWTGDVLLSMYIAASSYNDLRLFRRGIEQSAYCARSDGMVAGLSPGGEGYLSSYAAQWVTVTLNYFDLTGDSSLLHGMYPYAVRNMKAFEDSLGHTGVSRKLGWAFIDWGYEEPKVGTDMALNMHVLEAFRNMARWSRLVGRDSRHYEDTAMRLEIIVRSWLDRLAASGAWDEVGYHCTVLAYRIGLIPDLKKGYAEEVIRKHISRCFPNNLRAPRLSDPGVTSRQLITPYFSYYSFPILVAGGDMNFVLGQYRTCWGWALSEGLTTQPEVFDLGWSHCHVWASSPTAQLSRFVLGLAACFGRGKDHFELKLMPGRLDHASGKVPFPNGTGAVAVAWRWRKADGKIAYTVNTPHPIWIHLTGSAEPVRVEREREFILGPGAYEWLQKLDK